MGSSCSGISWENGLCKWKKYLTRVLTSLLSFNLLFALEKKNHVWIAWEQNKRELQLELEGKG